MNGDQSCSRGSVPGGWRPPSSLLLPGGTLPPGAEAQAAGSLARAWLVNYQGGSAGRAARPFPSRGWRAPHSTSGRLRLCSHPGLPEAHGLTSTFGSVGRSTLGKDHSHLSRDPRPPTSPLRPCTWALVTSAESAPPKTASRKLPFRQALQVVGCMSETETSCSGWQMQGHSWLRELCGAGTGRFRSARLLISA